MYVRNYRNMENGFRRNFKADSMLKNNESAADSIEEAIKAVEDFEYYKSVGYGGLPNEEMEVELDAAFMDGDTLEFGCVGGVKDFANPVSIARSLMYYDANNFLIGQGAEKYASRHGFERKTMLTDRAKIHYHNRTKEITNTELKPYSGHDTVGMVCLDTAGTYDKCYKYFWIVHETSRTSRRFACMWFWILM